MASELTLEINGHKRYILGYYFGFHRNIQYNRPVQSVWGGEICVEMTSGSDTVFLEMLMAEREIVQTSTKVCDDNSHSCFWQNTICQRR